MALTRKMLKALGIEDDKIEQICDAHTETLEEVKNERDKYKADAEKLASVQKELDELKAANSGESGREALQAKYDKLDKEFKEFRKSVEDEKTLEKTKAAYRELLKETGVSEKRLDTVLKVADLSSVKLDNDGKIIEADKLKKGIETEWADFITTEGAQGANPANPPKTNPDSQHSTGRAKAIATSYFTNLYGSPVKEGN